jgi:hypothetical protein
MATTSWYWYRLRAMTPSELGLRAWQRVRQVLESKGEWRAPHLDLRNTASIPRLSGPDEAPALLREALRRDATDILAGRWKAFGHLALSVDDPPMWYRDNLAGQECPTNRPSANLNHRELPLGTDIKVIWELSRWHQLVRLAMASYVLGDETARSKCLDWLDDWVAHNPPYRGWNWTSALESGVRLVQFTWLDALFSHSLDTDGQVPDWVSRIDERLERLRSEILPAHVAYTWRHRSFGSSANNHLLGELAGCLLATIRWPELASLAAPLPEMQAYWEREVLAQFAEDGGNREQALNYHLFSLEFCCYTLKALHAAGRDVSPAVQDRLASAGEFFHHVQVESEPWDYGDSDGAFVTPLFSEDPVTEWYRWLKESLASPSLRYWLGDSPRSATGRLPAKGTEVKASGTWRTYPTTGIAVCTTDSWWLRWDVSPLGYLSTAAHGHLDALHLSIWHRRIAVVVDPGTGAYYSDTRIRDWLSSRAAHNGPCPEGEEKPRRLGPFLWAEHHARPTLRCAGGGGEAGLDLGGTRIRRRLSSLYDGHAWQVDDDCFGRDGTPCSFTVRWQFPPDASVTRLTERSFSLERKGASITIQIGEEWTAVAIGQGIVSPAFRTVCTAPYLYLTARRHGGQYTHFRTTFLDSECA